MPDQDDAKAPRRDHQAQGFGPVPRMAQTGMVQFTPPQTSRPSDRIPQQMKSLNGKTYTFR